MKYISPYRFIRQVMREEEQSSNIDDKTLQQIRKRLFAEFEVNQTITIEVDGEKFDRSQIIRALDSFEQDWDFHVKVLNDPVLLRFLEKGELPTPFDGFAEMYNDDQEFLFFISPYFATQYNEAYYTHFKNNDLDRLNEIKEVPLLVHPIETDHCHQNISRNLRQKLKDLKDTNYLSNEGSDFKKLPKKSIEVFTEDQLIRKMYILPHYFDGIKNQYALALYELSINVFNLKKNRNLASRILDDAMLLATDLQTKAILQDLRWQYARMKLNARPSDWWMLFLMILLIAVFVGIVSNIPSCERQKEVTFGTQGMPAEYQPFTHPKLNLQSGMLWAYYMHNSVFETEITNLSADRPETGTVAYNHLFVMEKGSDTTETHELTVDNRSEHDVIVFITNDDREIRNYYVRSQDSLNIYGFVLDGTYEVSLYRGSDWIPEVSMDTILQKNYRSLAGFDATKIDGDFTMGVFKKPFRSDDPIEGGLAVLRPVEEKQPADSSTTAIPDSTVHIRNPDAVEPEPGKDYKRSLLVIGKDNKLDVGNRKTFNR
jgi:hypothetical protein